MPDTQDLSGRGAALVPPAKLVDVAVGVLIRGDGRVLLGQRPAGKPYAGWWEFPGGKLERGESVEQALARELREELGVDIAGSVPWVVREHVYPHAHVRLFFHRVYDWRGEPQAREGQQLRWLSPASVDVAPLLPATIPALGWLRLPPRYAISCAIELGDERFLERLQARLLSGLQLLQLREPGLGEARFDALFHRVRALCARHGARLLVNSRHPASYWRACDGVHLRADDLRALAERPAVRLVGASCHDAVELARAGALGADFAVLGPVRPTLTHPAAVLLGWEGFERLARSATLPVYALGGLDEDDAVDARQAGAHGLAMIRSSWR